MSTVAPTLANTVDAAPPRPEWLSFVKRLSRRRTALFGLIVIALVVLTSAAAPWVTPFDPVEQDIAVAKAAIAGLPSADSPVRSPPAPESSP